MDYDLQVENFTIEKEMYYKNTLVLSFKISYPQFRSSCFAAAVNEMNRYYKTKAFSFKRYCERQMYPAAVKEYEYSVANGFPVRKHEAQVDYTITYQQDCAVSLYFDQYQFTGGAHGNTVRYSQTWNLQTGCRIRLEQLFPCQANYKIFLIQTINSQIAEQIQNGHNDYFENYSELVADTFQPESFYLTPEGLAVYFQQYDIAPYSSGIPVFIIPYSECTVVRPVCKRL